MARKTVQTKKNPNALFAWLALIVVIMWIFANWPRDINETAEPVSTSSESTTTATTATPEADAGRQAQVVAATLNFRSRPESDPSNVLKTLTQGTMMKVLKQENGWLFVELDGGESGYVADQPDFVKIIE
jgi:uncharacterized protein YgiM (DUF1202 family)